MAVRSDVKRRPKLFDLGAMEMPFEAGPFADVDQPMPVYRNRNGRLVRVDD